MSGNNLDFSVWLIEQSKDRGFHYLGDGLFRYKYCSSYSIEEMFDFYSAGKVNKDLSMAHQPIKEDKLKSAQRTFDM